MKKTVLNTLALAILFFASAANAQVGVGVPAGDIHPSAELEVKSTTKGFLPPRMTNVERNAIISPATGLLIYQTDAVANNPAGLYFFDGTSWKNGLGVVGPTGPKGDQGTPGAQGPKGDVGSTGAKGDVGATGPQGQKGATGDQGTPGAKGDVGATGPQGQKGDNGDTGNGFNNGTATNQIMYWNGGEWVTLNPGSDNQFLKISNGNLNWSFIDGYAPSITDIDGTLYKTVNIGSQQWMAENLKVTKYNDGTDIPNIIKAVEWSSLTTGAWAYYDNNEANNAKYGKLYNWYAVSPTTNGNKNICPSGWHVPTDAEWTVLTEYLGGETVAGSKMKEPGTTNWPFANEDANNSSLFTAVAGGSRNYIGEFPGMTSGTFWSSTLYGTGGSAYIRMLIPHNGYLNSTNYSKMIGLSVRCLKD